MGQYSSGTVPVTNLVGTERVVVDTGGAVIATTTTRDISNLGLTGNSWFVNETTGSDTNPGTAALPFASLAAAQSAAVANNGDVVYLTGTCHVTATLNWAKNDVALVGLNSPSNNCRARISPSTTINQTQATALHPMVNVTANGCSFVNIEAFYGFDGILTPPTAAVCWLENGGRNFYSNVQLRGFGDALMAALAGARALQIKGIGENQFDNCVFGGDTEQRITNLNATIELTNGTARNVIKRSIFESWNGLSTNLQILVNAGGMDRYLILDGVTMHNFGTAMAVAITNTAGGGPNGNIILTPTCVSVGATVIATSGAVYVGGPVPTANTSNLGILAT